MKNGYMLAETALVWSALAWAICWLDGQPGQGAFAALTTAVVGQGFWLHRIYMIGHEAGHRKLFSSRLANDVLGQLAVLPILMPMRVYRKIHVFHHAFNRKDVTSAALDTFVVEKPESRLVRAACYLVWLVAVFGGGFFLHSLVSVVLFLALPLRVARRVSPAFRGWREKDRWVAMVELIACLVFHGALALALGWRAWALIAGLPMLVFAWVYSLLIYIYHYRTTYGHPTTRNVRSLGAPRAFSWWLLHFNEHATHHAEPALPWYELPDRRTTLEAMHGANQQVHRVGEAILFLLRGPHVVRRET